MLRYGLQWPEETDPLEIEFAFICAGGFIEKGGIRYGKGKFHHYTEATRLLWPDDDEHRWATLMLKRKCENEILVMMGASDSNKTYSTSRYILCDYWASPGNTLWLVSSTELRGAELRIWGKIKELFNRARQTHPWLAGTCIDSRTCITTQEIDKSGQEARMLTKGIIFIPCKRAEGWVGLGAYAGIKPTKNGRLRHAGDEVSFMERSFLQAYANWYGKPNFEGILQGNPTDIEDPLCVAAEPDFGWDNWHDTKKTQEWRSKWYGAWVIAFDGRDSPNFDYPANLPIRFPYLVSRKKLDAVAKAEGEDSPLYWMQAVGKPQPGAQKLKIITRQLCEEGQAYDKVIWATNNVVNVAGLDAAYSGEGGDRCALERGRFGMDVDGNMVIAASPPVIVPIKVTSIEKPETQIARFCKVFCEGFGIPPSNFGFDGRSTLAVEFARVWSSEVVAVDFGGPPTDRPVTLDHWVFDEVTKKRRLKRCDEHYSKFVTELWFAVHYCIRARQMRELPQSIAEEGWKRQWHLTKGQPAKIEAESKKEMKERTHQSPDYFDSLVTMVEMSRRLGFQIKNLREAKRAAEEQDDWLKRQYDQYRKFMKRHELKPTH